MGTVEKLIYNVLVAREAVNLPEVGSLRVEMQAAKFLSKDKLRIPIVRIIFSSQPLEGASSIIELISSYGQMDSDEALAYYKKWLNASSNNGEIQIEGVGTIKNNFFYPSSEMNAILALDNGNIIKIKPRAKSLKAVFIILFLVILSGVAYYYFSSQAAVQKQAPYTQLTPIQQTKKTPSDQTPKTKSSEDQMVKIETESGETKELNFEQVVNELDAGLKSRAEKEPEPKSASSKGKYCVVAGVFSKEANANKFALSGDGYEIIQTGSSRFLVSVYNSDSEDNAISYRDNIQNMYPGAWVYER